MFGITIIECLIRPVLEQSSRILHRHFIPEHNLSSLTSRIDGKPKIEPQHYEMYGVGSTECVQQTIYIKMQGENLAARNIAQHC